MFLKRLELAGFKSFANPVSIEFEDGVTAVVGPNGSGKSNISDAVRWVLGEQSARNLRGAKMEDVIFSGSETRAALPMAEISLVLNNEDSHLTIDYSEVAVTRRVYRSGDSEYLINDHPCRLKDIVELFMDSGLGKESFSIIGQGRVEEILSSKAEDRRAIFEEAAGVRKYKQRKQQSEKKLGDTEDNLKRVRDIIYELEAQVGPLEEQASVASEYKAQKEELKLVEVGVLAEEIKTMHADWTENKQKFSEIGARKQRLQSSVERLEKKLHQKVRELKEADAEVEELQKMLLKISEDTEKQEGLKELWKERKKHYSQNRQQYRKELEQLQDKRSQLERVLEQEKQSWQNIHEKTSATQKKLAEVNEKMNNIGENKEAELEDLKSEYIDKLNNKTSLSNEFRYLEEQQLKITASLRRKEESNTDLLKSRKEQQQMVEKIEEEWNQAKEEVTAQIHLWKEKNQSLEAETRKYDDKESLYYEGLRHLQQMEAKQDTLETMQQDYAGFFSGVKHVLKERDKSFPGIHGAVAELLTVPAHLQLAVETALGAAQQHVVVEDEATGRRAIQFLRDRNLGRATFLPKSVVKPRNIPAYELQKLNTYEAYLGVGSDLVEADSQYEGIVNHVLGNVIFATNLKEAKSLAQSIQYKFRIVTLDGDVLSPGGAMSGGSVQKKQGQLLGRQREIDDIKNKISILREQTETLEHELKEWKNKKLKWKQDLQQLADQGEDLREKERKSKMKLEEAKLHYDSLQTRLRVYDMETQETIEEKSANEKRIEQLKSEIEKVSGILKTSNDRIQELSNRKEHDASLKSELLQQQKEFQIALAKEEEQEAHALRALERMKSEYQALTKEIIEKDEANSLIEAELSEQAVDASSVEVVLEEKKQQKQELIGKVDKSKINRDELSKAQREIESELRDTVNQHTYHQEQHHAVEIIINRLDVELDSRLGHLQNEYELTFEAALKEYPLQQALEEAKEKVKLLKMGIEELGEVNLGAIDEYARVKERYDFLLEQKNDLEDAKQTLQDIISEMDEEMTSRFESTFTEIQGHFKDVFSELFGGGKAALELTNKEDLLSTGVEIVAQPPGKKLQNLALLSGGERALTAIALLFAILRARPVPFCVLDEVEAALDEANVQRFAGFLKDFSHNTQFVVVTHRKGTMEEADALYGVTMQESGVSNLVSVKLGAAEELVEAGAVKEGQI
ncbi:chromosome segregation protein SMC [Alkalicoccus daliensis]|uniref:Chromosome partition protein Smc n=1 Tax=Alkalicoccus daliensis TaxID=745820 RepID=A0A1G9ZZD9_9BACI|nr:chromosome segregation protein SMC [Alkalicoccus daliensis]SDN27012.1 condensin subunit Smc [Alkalicoccus daliensis]